ELLQRRSGAGCRRAHHYERGDFLARRRTGRITTADDLHRPPLGGEGALDPLGISIFLLDDEDQGHWADSKLKMVPLCSIPKHPRQCNQVAAAAEQTDEPSARRATLLDEPSAAAAPHRSHSLAARHGWGYHG